MTAILRSYASSLSLIIKYHNCHHHHITAIKHTVCQSYKELEKMTVKLTQQTRHNSTVSHNIYKPTLGAIGKTRHIQQSVYKCLLPGSCLDPLSVQTHQTSE